MRLTIDDDFLTHTDSKGITQTYPLGSPEAFKVLSQAWLRSGWDTKYVYSFSWLGRPLIQLPEDVLRLQEVIYTLRPDLIIETGVAHGGGLVFYATLLEVLGNGRVIGIDIDIRQHNLDALLSHPLNHRIDLVQGSSTDPGIVSKVHELARHSKTCLVILDSDHSRSHVLKEMQAYSDLVSIDSYFVVCDGIMADLVGAPRSGDDWAENNPQTAIVDFLQTNSCFAIEEPHFQFNEGAIHERVTYWPNAYVKRVC